MSDNNVNLVELAEVNTSEIDNAKPFLNQSNIEIISEMEVQLHVEIGGFSVSVSDLYQFKPGSVVKLGSKINEPLKIFFGEKIVAEGILVAEDEHYAIEITQVADFT